MEHCYKQTARHKEQSENKEAVRREIAKAKGGKGKAAGTRRASFLCC